MGYLGFPLEDKDSEDRCWYSYAVVAHKCEHTNTSHPYGMQKLWDIDSVEQWSNNIRNTLAHSFSEYSMCEQKNRLKKKKQQRRFVIS